MGLTWQNINAHFLDRDARDVFGLSWLDARRENDGPHHRPYRDFKLGRRAAYILSPTGYFGVGQQRRMGAARTSSACARCFRDDGDEIPLRARAKIHSPGTGPFRLAEVGFFLPAPRVCWPRRRHSGRAHVFKRRIFIDAKELVLAEATRRPRPISLAATRRHSLISPDADWSQAKAALHCTYSSRRVVTPTGGHHGSSFSSTNTSHTKS